MARFLNINPTYSPITLDEYLKVPTIMYKEQKEREEELNNMGNTMDMYEIYARQYPNSEASRQYLSFLDKFNTAVDDISNGRMGNINAVSNLQREFRRTSAPFKQALATYSAIQTQRQKDANKGIIGRDIDFQYILEHPEYTAAMDKESYVTGQDIYNSAKKMFKGLGGYDTTPRTQLMSDGTYARYVPQGYTSNDFATALLDYEGGVVTPELQKMVDLFKNQNNFNALSEDEQQAFLYYAYQGAVQNAKDPKVSSGFTPKNISTMSGSVSGQTGKPTNGEYYNRDIKGFSTMKYYDQDGNRVYKSSNSDKYYHIKLNDKNNLVSVPITKPITLNGTPYRPTKDMDGHLTGLGDKDYEHKTIPSQTSSGPVYGSTGSYNTKKGVPQSTNPEKYQPMSLSNIANLKVNIGDITSGKALSKKIQAEVKARLKDAGYTDEDLKNIGDLTKLIDIKVQQDSKNVIVGYTVDVKNPNYIKKEYKNSSDLISQMGLSVENFK